MEENPTKRKSEASTGHPYVSTPLRAKRERSSLNLSSDYLLSDSSPRNGYTAFISSLELHQQEKNASLISTHKSKREYDSLTRDFMKLDDSDLNDFDPDVLTKDHSNSIYMMSDDPMLEEFNLEEVIDGANRCQNLQGRFVDCDKRRELLSTTIMLSQHDANSWDVSVSENDTSKPILSDHNCNEQKTPPSSKKIALESARSDKIDVQSSLPATLSNLTSHLDFCKRIKNQLLENSSKTDPVMKEQHKLHSNDEEPFFGMPHYVKQLISKHKGIADLYPWQKECLSLKSVNNRKNLIYALPTSGGKTLVAEILILKELLCREKNVIFILPYVSIVQEKVRSLAPFGIELNFLVEEYAAGKGTFPPTQRRRKRTIYVATIEKASSLVNSLLETNRLQDEIGLICIDEIHLIGEPRGAILESTLTKIMYINEEILKSKAIQIIGMSATIGNLKEIAQFLNADTFTQDFRPVELTEYVKCGDKVFSITNNIEGKQLVFTRSVQLQLNDPDYVAGLVAEVIPADSCLVFCASKKNCENVALLISRSLNESAMTQKAAERGALLRALAAEGNGSICPILAQTLPFGVVYHHSGLTTGERKLLEEGFCSNTICCICCTSTLAAGVNLPAKRVIIRSPYVGKDFITFSRYKQMIGRAGRAGFGKEGESYLLCQPSDTLKVTNLINSKVDSCDSQLLEGKALPSLLLSAIGLNLADTDNKLKMFLNSSLLHAQRSFDSNIDDIVMTTIEDLRKVGALQTKETDEGSQYELSKLGKAAIKGNITIDEAKILYADLKEALKCVSLSNYLHRLYLITPYSMVDQIPINRVVYFNVFMSLREELLNVAEMIGVTEGCVMKFMAGKKFKDVKSEKRMHRFYLTLILHSLWEGRSVWQVASIFNLSRGLVHSFLTSAATFNSCVVRFCEELSEMKCVALLLKEMSERLTHCCAAELLPLMELPSVKLGRAKQLLNAGFKNLLIIANSDANSMVSKVDHLPKRVAHQIIAAAKLLLLARAELLQEEAELMLEGLNGMKIS